MSQINTTANKFDYSKVNLTDPADGINLFGPPLSKIIEYDVTANTFDGVFELFPPDTISKKLTSSIQLYHIHGCIHKDIIPPYIEDYDIDMVFHIVYYVKPDYIDKYCYIPMDPHTSDDYFDIYFYLSQPEIAGIFMETSVNGNEGYINEYWTVDAHVSIYQVA